MSVLLPAPLGHTSATFLARLHAQGDAFEQRPVGGAAAIGEVKSSNSTSPRTGGRPARRARPPVVSWWSDGEELSMETEAVRSGV